MEKTFKVLKWSRIFGLCLLLVITSISCQVFMPRYFAFEVIARFPIEIKIKSPNNQLLQIIIPNKKEADKISGKQSIPQFLIPESLLIFDDENRIYKAKYNPKPTEDVLRLDINVNKDKKRLVSYYLPDLKDINIRKIRFKANMNHYYIRSIGGSNNDNLDSSVGEIFGIHNGDSIRKINLKGIVHSLLLAIKYFNKNLSSTFLWGMVTGLVVVLVCLVGIFIGVTYRTFKKEEPTNQDGITNWLFNPDSIFYNLKAICETAAVLGPSFGFMLTVSGMIEALSPRYLLSKSLIGFSSGVYLSLISTFIGLSIRIISIICIRIIDKYITEIKNDRAATLSARLGVQ